MAMHLVTGGAGFIGSHLSDRLAAEGRRVRIVDDFSTGRRSNVALLKERYGARVEVVEGDLRDPRICSASVEGCGVIHHHAALPSVERSVRDPLASHEVNATGTLNLLIAARDAGVARFIYASSSSVYGDTPALPKVEEQPPEPRSPYALSKLAGEEYTRLFHELFGLSTVSLRYFNVFGPRQDPNSPYAAVIPRFVTALLRREPPRIFGDGLQSRDFTYVENVVAANLAAAERKEATGPINIACGEQTSLLELLQELSSILGIAVDPSFLDPRPGDVRHSRADIGRAQRLLGFAPETGLQEGLRRTVASLKEGRTEEA
ncbi:MAG: NAD-dependent epimerase/dehydratase family protein [Candidatus Eisenbacteria bacterium]|nr:NAD-dependent epimerase/dehydratase family protein [Candidatus Eisenbacteria bacterium]